MAYFQIKSIIFDTDSICGVARIRTADSVYFQILPHKMQETSYNADNYAEPEDIEVSSNDTLLFNAFVNILIEVSTEQLRNVKSNVMNNYNLHGEDIANVKKAFNNIEERFTEIVNTKLRAMLEGKRINVTDHFMIDFMDVSNYILEKVLRYHIKNVKGKLITPTTWLQQTLKEKIMRQQMKISVNFIENNICDTLQICRDRYYYTDYLIDWCRTLMNIAPRDLKRFFVPVTEVLENHKFFITSNIKFRQTIKYIINSESMVKRDTLDFIDEILTNPDKMLKLAPDPMKPSVTLLRELFNVIDGVYDVNDHNIEYLENITEMLRDWADGRNFDIHKVLNAIVVNMKVNLKKWPLDIQNKIFYLWSEIIVL